MDVIKTSLIIGIAITFYYLLLQWPANNQSALIETEDKYISNYNDSEPSLSEPLTPLSTSPISNNGNDESEDKYFQIQNESLSLLVNARTGRFEFSKLKTISKSKDSDEPFMVLGKTLNKDSGIENIYFANKDYIFTTTN